MTETKSERRFSRIIERMDAENRKLRFELQQAKDKIREERRARYLVEDARAVEHQILANNGWRLNGIGR